MSTISQETTELAEAMRLAMIALRTLVNGNQTTLAALNTTDKTSLVAAVNELVTAISGVSSSLDDITGLGTGVATALGIAANTAGGVLTHGSAISGTTGTFSGDTYVTGANKKIGTNIDASTYCAISSGTALSVFQFPSTKKFGIQAATSIADNGGTAGSYSQMSFGSSKNTMFGAMGASQADPGYRVHVDGTFNVTGNSTVTNLTASGTVTATGNVILPTSTTPASATAAGVAGAICRDSDYIYVAVGTNTWKRAALTTW